MSNHNRSRDFLIGATVGSLLGTVSALLLAPKSGRKLRQDLCDTCCEMTDKTQDITNKLNKKKKMLNKGIKLAYM